MCEWREWDWREVVVCDATGQAWNENLDKNVQCIGPILVTNLSDDWKCGLVPTNQLIFLVTHDAVCLVSEEFHANEPNSTMGIVQKLVQIVQIFELFARAEEKVMDQLIHQRHKNMTCMQICEV